MDIVLAQNEADALIALPKSRAEEIAYAYPSAGGSLSVPLVSTDKREHFLLDIWQGRVELVRGRYQTRARQVIVLARLDFGGAPHRNPDGEEIGVPHLHVYREGWADKWAHALPSGSFSSTTDRSQMLEEFMKFCVVVRPPLFNRGLFS